MSVKKIIFSSFLLQIIWVLTFLMLTPTKKMIIVLITVIIFFILHKKRESRFVRLLNRSNDFINLSEREFRRLKVVLSSDCDLSQLLVSKEVKTETVSPPQYVKKDSTVNKQNSNRTIKTKETSNIKECVEKWYNKNHENLEKVINELSEQEIYTLQIEQYIVLPPKDCFTELCKKLSDEWNVSYDICDEELHISWYQI